ncbi:hypothetical protein [Paenarthrobacter sp. PH39-S1]|uniref:hypothetical protein n=1 Tax=Paenarthrobacter sp. PH39-S1 TaxID=3046204 RepID=UPI0024BB7DD9|nr:hypothetical protein [Paenarthrobacter sp. PH39-S1]MDJ0356795.1 hypothetical protein [Paenarthrobacter sp. PH39-S1]
MFQLIKSLWPTDPWLPVPDNFDTGTRAEGGRDFITVDGGTFEYAPSATAVARSFEYSGQAQCIVDRAGNNYPLFADERGGVILGASMGKADLVWLRHAWAEAQQDQPRKYPLIRNAPPSDAGFLAALFEVLTAAAAGDGNWSVQLHRRKFHVETLREAGAQLLKEGDLSNAVVRDPYGHFYRPIRQHRSPLALTDRHFLVYRETCAP